MSESTLHIAIAQMSPVWLNRAKTIEKILSKMDEAGRESCDLIVFPEAILPGYPFWLTLTHGSKFNSKIQKEIHAHYMRHAVDIEAGDVAQIAQKAAQYKMAVYLGAIERPADRGGHSIYCTLIYIDKKGEIKSIHRKLQPTYEERLTWSQGDGHGLQVHVMGEFKLGGLNCWENWMPLSRTALYGQGENVHVAVWPGEKRNTENITRFIAEESRSFVISACGIMRRSDFPADTPHLEVILNNAPELIANGGSCVANPDGTWLIEPQVNEEKIIYADLNHQRILEERQNFDIAGHYSRPDVTKLVVNRKRQSILNIEND